MAPALCCGGNGEVVESGRSQWFSVGSEGCTSEPICHGSRDGARFTTQLLKSNDHQMFQQALGLSETAGTGRLRAAAGTALPVLQKAGSILTLRRADTPSTRSPAPRTLLRHTGLSTAGRLCARECEGRQDMMVWHELLCRCAEDTRAEEGLARKRLVISRGTAQRRGLACFCSVS